MDQNFGQQQYQSEVQPVELAQKFQAFIKEWMVDNIFIYRNQLILNGEARNFFLKIIFTDIETYDMQISQEIRRRPMFILPVLENALRELYLSLKIVE